MKAVDHARAFGADLGKAMQPLAKGRKGLILVLVEEYVAIDRELEASMNTQSGQGAGGSSCGKSRRP